MIDIKGKTALITGSSRGIGQQIAIGLAKLGCDVILHGRKIESCAPTLDLLMGIPVRNYVVHGDLSEEEGVRDVIRQVRNLKVDVDILYNNAAIMTGFRENIWEHSWEDWVKTYKVNVVAMYLLCGAFIPGMIRNKFGRVVNLTSGIKGEPELAPYSVSKGAVDKLTEDIASTLGDTGVRINMLDPGWLRTDMGGPYADLPVKAVLPGALAPALINDKGANGKYFSAIHHKLKAPLW